MAQLSIPEKIEMVLLYGECRRSVIDAVALYAERFPDRNAISRASFYRVVKEFTENGTVELVHYNENLVFQHLATVSWNPTKWWMLDGNIWAPVKKCGIMKIFILSSRERLATNIFNFK
ncbi:hypothetical protein NQ315_016044 [Exocentrus adspersus]|uniref:DUF4817 domain-containing protein n=1 Tax=Exocentrus adspersus TaxID=1586481 RepID=A0AAV8VKZ9_9CUCU|nr:hypothetical protein NQ315_016044 [Exocentrus adspersus]